MKIIQAILLTLILGNTLFAQSNLSIPNWQFIDKATIPVPSADMPTYVRLLYADQVDLRQLDRAYTAYYEERGWEKQMEDLEHDPYAKFFNQWYRSAQNYIGDDAMVYALNTKTMLAQRAASKKLEAQIHNDNRDGGPSSAWSFLGPKRTVWRADHRAGQQVAPWQINIYSIAVAPSNPSILYCGSETGVLYKSTDKGLNWTPFNDFNWGRAILSVAIHPTDPNTVYAASSTDIFKTTDGGTSWSIIYTESGLSCNSLAISPSTPNTIFAGSANGLYRSTDAGTNWTEVLTEHIDDVEFRPNDGTTIYALARNGSPDTYSFYKSTDSGANFSLSMTGWSGYVEESGGRITVTPADPDYVYAILLTQDGTGNDKKPYILKSTNSASSWTTVAVGNSTNCPLGNGQGYYDLDIVASHVNAETLIAATTTAYRSSDGGTTWSAIGGYSGDFDIHPDIQAMVCIIDGMIENTWLTTDGGINFSTDFYSDTENWEARIDGLDGTDFWGFAQGWNEDYLVGGRYHNGNTVIHESYPDNRALRLGGAESVTGWAMHGRERYAAFDDISELILPTSLDEAPKGSFLFTKHPQNYYYGDAFSRVMVDLEDFMTIYLGEGNDFWRSEDGGASWESIHTFGGKPYHFDISRANPNHLFLTTDDGFYRSTDRGETFTEMSLPSGLSDWHSQNFRVAASSADENTVWVLNHRSGASSTAGRVFKSIDGGATWTDWSTTKLAGRKWTAMAHQAGTDGGIYLASNRGDAGTNPSKVMYRDNSMSDWADFSNNLPQSANPIKILPFYRDGKLRWGGNRGAWEVDFYEENWTPIVQPFVGGKSQFCTRDTVEFDSYSVAKGTASYSWSIPDATWTSNLNAREVNAVFPNAGSYSATLTINQDGAVSSKSISFTVEAECDAETMPGNAISMSGESTDYAASSKALNVTTNTITMSTWIKRNGDQNAYAGILFMREGTACGLNFRENNELGYHWDNSRWWWSSGLVVPDNEWAHVAIVASPTEVRLYLNGVAAVDAVAPAAVNFDGVLNFGADPNWSARRFKGEMDEVLVYNRALSQDEIRSLMHLTRTPADETDLLAYWQFNRSSGSITDRVGTNHASLIGGTTRITSTAPVGAGESHRMDVTSAGNYTFGTTGLTLDFSASSSIFPNGELCVTRIDQHPDYLPSSTVSPAYWIIHNYGTNASFDELTSLQFDGIGNVPASAVANPQQLKLYKRNSNADGDTWGGIVDNADAAIAGTNGSATFSTGNGQTSFSQFLIALESSLPVDLLNFNASINREKQVDLDWTTISEENFQYFEVQKSIDGMEFETFATIQGQGTQNESQNYKIVDRNPYKGQSYYRLKMVDRDGSFDYSKVRSIVFDALADKVVVYPNPISNGQELMIKTELTEPIEIRFYSTDGEAVGTFQMEGNTSLKLPNWPAGIYGYIIQSSTWRKSDVLMIID